MDKLNRRHFMISSALSAASISLFGQKSFSKTKTLETAAPVWPELPRASDTDANAPEKLETMKAKTEQKSESPTRPLNESEKIGFAIVGLGELALNEILPAIGSSKMCKVTALVSGDPAKAKRVADEYNVPSSGIYSYENFDLIQQNPHVQVIYIVLPNSMHKEFTLRSAKAGKHVLCEKPMAVSSQEAEEMIKACENAKVKLMIAYRQQYEPNNRWIRELVRNKTFGDLKFFEATNFQVQAGKDGGKQQWRHVKKMAGGGALPDIGLYCLNAARFLAGEEPEEVQATMYSTPKDPRFKEIEETISWLMRFPSGLVAMCAASYGGHETKRYRFTAEGGWFGMDPSFAYHGLKTEVGYALGSQFEHHDHPTIQERNQFALEMDHMADCVRRNREPHTGGLEGLQDHKIMEAIYESATSGKPVKISSRGKIDFTRANQI